MSRSKPQCPPKQINNPSPLPSEASSGHIGLVRLARLLSRQEAKAERLRPAASIERTSEGGSYE